MSDVQERLRETAHLCRSPSTLELGAVVLRPIGDEAAEAADLIDDMLAALESMANLCRGVMVAHFGTDAHREEEQQEAFRLYRAAIAKARHVPSTTGAR